MRPMRYQTFRSGSDVHVFVLCYDGSFYERVPEDVRKQGPRFPVGFLR